MEESVFQSSMLIDLSSHAEWRMSQRNISPLELEFVLLYGRCLHRAGAIFCLLRKSDIPASLSRNAQFSRLEGTIVVLSVEQNKVITIYRNRQKGWQCVKRKSRQSTSLLLN
jgi:hypothetical protein